MTRSTTSLDDVAYDAMDVLATYFDNKKRGKKLSPEDHAAARIAQGVVSSWTRFRATESAMDALKFMIAREVANDESGKLAGHVRRAFPALPFQLPGRTRAS